MPKRVLNKRPPNPSRVRNKVAIAWVLCLFCITAALLLWHQYGMNRAFIIDDESEFTITTLDDRGVGGDSVATVQKANGAIILHCALSDHYQWPYCGFGVLLTAHPGGINASRFNTIELNISSHGPIPTSVKIYLLNADPAYSTIGETGSYKINAMQYRPGKQKHKLVVPLKSLHVAPWWLNERHIAPDNAGLDFRHIQAIQVFTGDIFQTGNYTITVDSIVLHGKWLNITNVLSIVLFLWLASATVFVVTSIWNVRHEMQAVRRHNRELENINNALSLQRRHLEVVASHDELTGLHNRVGLRNYLIEHTQRGRRAKTGLVAIFMDIDHFKQVNDQHGHVVGDQVLREFATRIDEGTRGQDFFCRWGGEEFILLTNNTTLAAACRLAEQLRVLIETAQWPKALPITCSFGVVKMQPNEPIASLIERADQALYAAKSAGRNCVYPNNMH